MDAAILLATSYPYDVYCGTNLYATLGSTGVMDEQRETDSVRAPRSRSQRYRAAAAAALPLGSGLERHGADQIISDLVTGAGGTGNYALDSAALIGAESGLQYDGVHQNGSVAAGGGVIADSIKAVLWQRPVQ